MTLPADWQAAVRASEAAAPATFDDRCFRYVELQRAHPDEFLTGEGSKVNGGRWVPIGRRATYGSMTEVGAVVEVESRASFLGGFAASPLPARVMYNIRLQASHLWDIRPYCLIRS